MNWLDIIILIALGIGFWKGLLNGFFVELTSLIALIAGIYGAIFFSNFAGEWLRERTEWDEIYITIASFITTFVIIILVIRYIGKLVTKVVDTAKLGTINKIAGAAFGLLKMAFITSVLLMFAGVATGEYSMLSREFKSESLLFAVVEPLAPAFLPQILEQADRVDRSLRGDTMEEDANPALDSYP
jgi:membrane protein required for colicin V production